MEGLSDSDGTHRAPQGGGGVVMSSHATSESPQDQYDMQPNGGKPDVKEYDKRFEVAFEGLDDPENPKSISFGRKWVITLVIASSSLCVCVGCLSGRYGCIAEAIAGPPTRRYTRSHTTSWAGSGALHAWSPRLAFRSSWSDSLLVRRFVTQHRMRTVEWTDAGFVY